MIIDQISMSYDGKRKHLDNVSTELAKGKITTIIGPNGSGKSTLLSVISRNHMPKTGNVLLDGLNIADFKAKDFAKQLAIVYQHNTSPDGLTVEKLVAFGRVPYQSFIKRPTEEDEQVIEWALESTNLLRKRLTPLTDLSGGERQRVWIAMALAQKTPILCLDEPTTYLDMYYQLELLDLVKRLNKEHGLTIVMVLHDMNQAIQYSDHIILMQQGKIIAEGTPAEVITTERVRDVYNVEAKIYEDDEAGIVVVPMKTASIRQ